MTDTAQSPIATATVLDTPAPIKPGAQTVDLKSLKKNHADGTTGQLKEDPKKPDLSGIKKKQAEKLASATEAAGTTAEAVQDSIKEAQAATTEDQPDWQKNFKHKVKVKGVEKELNWDEFQKMAQKGFGADELFEQTAKTKKEMEAEKNLVEAAKKELIQALSELKGNTAGTLKALGIDPKAFAEQLIMDEILETTNPDKAKAMKWEAEQKRKAEIADQQRKAAEEAATKEAEATYLNTFTNDCVKVMKDHKMYTENSKNNLLITKQIAYYIEQGLHNNLALTPADVIDQVKKDAAEYVPSLYMSLSDEELESSMPKELLDRIRQINIKKIKTPESKPVGKVNVPKKKVEQPSTKGKQSFNKTFQDWKNSKKD